MNLLDRFFGAPKPIPPPKPDPLRDLVERAEEANQAAWAEINRKRVQRGERPIAPAWEQLAGVGANGERRA